MFVVDNSNIIQPTKVLMLNTLKKNNPLEFSELFGINVELEGVEPSSKQGNHTLSTCLFQPLVFERRQDLDHQPSPYPQNFHQPIEA